MIRRFWLWLIEQQRRPTRLLPVPLRVQLALAATFELSGLAFGLVIAALASWSLAIGGVVGFVAGWIVGNVVGIAARVAGRNRPV